ncbi:PAAR-like domain-containing protein [Rhodopirellula sp. JC639]|uniref:PAAR-like domain-containing protein n=1 Tax=Stieleria mannarensis TaxID=2755585 RepID=UPI0015FF6E10|nr:PAAR-like domain-containing protein [Rhodopirellula sp. JC639]
MSNDVFANGREISCKAADGKSIAAFPDVCFTPPENPATPPGVPIPYPNTGMAKDTTAGSKKVVISGKEVMLKNKSHFKKSMGDEAGCAAKKGVLTSTNRGKVYFTMWSMDVKVEGKNVVRHMDMTTHNHMCIPGNTPLWIHIDSMANAAAGKCQEKLKDARDKCAEPDGSVVVIVKTKAGNDQKQRVCTEECEEAMKCTTVPKGKDKEFCCAPANTGHHVVPDSQFTDENGNKLPDYSYSKAPCVCVDGVSHSVGKHGEIHGATNTKTRAFLGVPPNTAIPNQTWPLAFAERIGAESVAETMGCDPACIEQQVRKGHAEMGIKRSQMVRPTTAGGERKCGPPIELGPMK